MTNIGDNGEYPLPDDIASSIEDLVTDKCHAFDTLWKNQLSFLDPIGKMEYAQREEMKRFAWKVYKEALEGFEEAVDKVVEKLQSVADEAYADGELDANECIREQLEDITKEINSNTKKLNRITNDLTP